MTSLGAGPEHGYPQWIGRYRVERPIAEGGMGHVFLATDPAMRRHVAIKLLKRILNDDPSVVRRFTREAVAVARLEHPAIVPVYDFGQHDDQHYFVMRYVAGGTLRDRIEQGPLPLREVARIVERVALALEATHAQGIVHRDIKPANILFDREGEAFLSDFGIAQVGYEAIHEEDGMRNANLMGTPKYLSPEQASGEEVDGRSDVYSLGVVAYHALTGIAPFDGGNAVAVAMAHVMDPPPPVRERLPSLPAIADAMFERVLAKRPSQRYDSALAFARDLRDIATGRWYMVKLSEPNVGVSRPRIVNRADVASIGTCDTGKFEATTSHHRIEITDRLPGRIRRRKPGDT